MCEKFPLLKRGSGEVLTSNLCNDVYKLGWRDVKSSRPMSYFSQTRHSLHILYVTPHKQALQKTHSKNLQTFSAMLTTATNLGTKVCTLLVVPIPNWIGQKRLQKQPITQTWLCLLLVIWCYVLCVMLPTHLSKDPSNLSQKCTQLPIPILGTVFNALSLGLIHFVRSVSLRNCYFIGWYTSTANQKLPFQGF